MSDFERSSNVKEERAQKAFITIIPGVIALVFAAIFFIWDKDGWTAGLRLILLIAGLGAVGFGVWQLTQIRKVTSYDIVCPFCQHKNVFTEQPMNDVRCDGCNREVPVQGGVMLQVFQVRCGFCNTLNWYSEKSTGLICEECDRAIPISTEEGAASPALQAYSRQDDTSPYNLMLLDPGSKHEEIIPVLQKMLALNRNQVKDILDDVPVILLQGIPKKKAELMAAQIQAHGGRADFGPTP